MEPDGKVNPLPVGPRISHQAEPASDSNFPAWPLVMGLLPFGIGLVVKGGIAGWPDAVDPSNLGFCLFAISLAAIARINEHRRGLNFISLLYACATLQVVIALLLSGAVIGVVTKGEVTQARSAMLQSPTSLSQAQADSVKTVLNSLHTTEHLQNFTFYVALILTGIVSIIGLIRWWAPKASLPVTNGQTS